MVMVMMVDDEHSRKFQFPFFHVDSKGSREGQQRADAFCRRSRFELGQGSRSRRWRRTRSSSSVGIEQGRSIGSPSTTTIPAAKV